MVSTPLLFYSQLRMKDNITGQLIRSASVAFTDISYFPIPSFPSPMVEISLYESQTTLLVFD